MNINEHTLICLHVYQRFFYFLQFFEGKVSAEQKIIPFIITAMNLFRACD